MVAEVDFPRGGEPERIGPKKRRRIIFGETGNKNSGDASRAKESEGVPVKENDEYEGVFRQNLTLELLAPGVCGLGIVKEINDVDVTLECSHGILVKLRGNCISKAFTNSLKTTEKTLDDIFIVGQAIAFKVTKSFILRDNHRKSKPEVTTCPYAVNSHLLLSNLLAGLVLNGIVTSVEEEGAVLDFGLSSKITGFVNANELPAYLTVDRLCVGQVLLVRVKTTPTAASRVVAVSAVPEMKAFNHDRLTLNQLMPGTILLAQSEKVTRSGIFVAFSNGLKGFVHKDYLPSRIDPSQVMKTLKLCVLACRQNSPLLILTGNAMAEKRALPAILPFPYGPITVDNPVAGFDDCEEQSLAPLSHLFGVDHLSECKNSDLFKYPVIGVVQGIGNRLVIPLKVRLSRDANDIVVFFVVDSGAPFTSFGEETARKISKAYFSNVFVQDTRVPCGLSGKFSQSLKDVNLLGSQFLKSTNTSIIFSPNKYDYLADEFSVFYLTPFSMINEVQTLASAPLQQPNITMKAKLYSVGKFSKSDPSDQQKEKVERAYPPIQKLEESRPSTSASMDSEKSRSHYGSSMQLQ